MSPKDGSRHALLAPRPIDSHKGDFGRCLLVGGSAGMCGAIALSGQSALRSGAGLVTVATPQPCVQLAASLEPCLMTLELPSRPDHGLDVAAARQRIERHRADVIGIGPGLGRDPSVEELVVGLYHEQPQAMVVDADGLNALARRQVDLREAAGPRILTPHPGEFRRLVGDSSRTVAELRHLSSAWAQDRNLILLLKGHQTLITDGTQSHQNGTGNPGMATGGSGDVLTGMVVALIGQGIEPYRAACLAAHLHGLAGDLAVAKYGEVSLIARDIIEYLPQAIQQYQADPA